MCALCTCDTLPCWPLSFPTKSSQMKADANYQANAAKGLQLILSRRKVWPGDRSKTERLQKNVDSWMPAQYWSLWKFASCASGFSFSFSLTSFHYIERAGILNKYLYWTKKKVILRVGKIEKHRNMWPSSIGKGILRVWQAKKTSGCERRK